MDPMKCPKCHRELYGPVRLEDGRIKCNLCGGVFGEPEQAAPEEPVGFWKAIALCAVALVMILAFAIAESGSSKDKAKAATPDVQQVHIMPASKSKPPATPKWGESKQIKGTASKRIAHNLSAKAVCARIRIYYTPKDFGHFKATLYNDASDYMGVLADFRFPDSETVELPPHMRGFTIDILAKGPYDIRIDELK